MSDPLFDPEKCNVPEVPKLDFDFVSECSIPEPPPPIFDCMPPQLPLEPPPPPCPSFESSIGLRSAISRDGGCQVAPLPTGALVVTNTDNDPCRFFIDLDFDIPIPPVPCPSFASGVVTVEVGYEGCVSGPTGVINVTKEVIPGDCHTQDSCKFTLDLDLQIPIPPVPCPSFASGAVTVEVGYKDCVSGPTGAITVTKEVIPGNCDAAESCKFTLDLDLQIPIPQVPCPSFASGAVTVEVGYKDCVSGPTGVINVTKEVIPGDCDTADSCKFTLDLDLQIPIPQVPCPSFASGVVTVAVGYENCMSGPTGVINVTKEVIPGDCDTADSCKFTLDLDLQIPIPQPPCPEITTTGAIEINPALSQPTMTFEVVASTVENDCEKTCKFDFDIDIEIPNICPEITATGVLIIAPGRVEPWLAFSVTKDPDPDLCKFDFDLELEFPPVRPCPEYTGVVTVYKSDNPTGVITFTLTPPVAPDEPCFYDVDLELGVPMCVPEFTVNHNIFCTPGRDAVTCTKFAITPTGATGCKYLATLDIEMPCVRPCPDITGVVTVYPSSELTGVLTVNHPTPTTASDQCFYELDLQLGVLANKLEKGTVTAGWTICTATPTCDVMIDPPDANGIQKIHIDVRVPQPPTYTGGTIDLGDFGSGEITIDDANPCNPVINARITLATNECPSSPE